jgi:RNA polymerase sigma-70 factor (ECF subfamily)
MGIPQQRRPEADSPHAEVWSWIERAQNGDSEAFGLIYERYRRDVLLYLLCRSVDPHTARDIVHDVFVRALKSISRYEYQGRDYGGLLVTIARNITIDRSRCGPAHYEAPVWSAHVFEREDPEPGPERLALRNDVRNDVRAVVADAMTVLTDKQRQVVFLRYFNGLSTGETAEAMGVDASVVKSLLYRAQQSMARVLPPNTIDLIRS